jgi:hypothetical protein
MPATVVAEQPRHPPADPSPPAELLSRLGFRLTQSGAHASRTMMLEDLARLLAAAPPEADAQTLRRRVVDENLLQRPSLRARKLTHFHLTRLYGLDPAILLYRVFRGLWETDPQARPLLAFCLAMARDPILRLSRDFVLGLPTGARITSQDTEAVLRELTGERFRSTSLRSYARNLNGSWTQTGFLAGHRIKRRQHPVATPANLAFALYLAHLQGADGAALFTSPWADLLDVPLQQRYVLARGAASRGLLVLRMAGEVVEVRFPHLPSLEELRRREREPTD